MSKKKVTSQLKAHEIAALETIVRKAVKRDGGWRKGVRPAVKKAGQIALDQLGRTKPEWDESIVIGKMAGERSAVRAKTSKNSID